MTASCPVSHYRMGNSDEKTHKTSRYSVNVAALIKDSGFHITQLIVTQLPLRLGSRHANCATLLWTLTKLS